MLPTNLRDYHLDIRCPRCDGRARWEEPFEVMDPARGRVPLGENADGFIRWGGWRIREKFPSLLRWKEPRRGQGWQHYAQGVVRCSACHLAALHRLRWPADAFFRWSVRGTPLWAWHAEHAAVLRDYVGAKVRDPFRYPQPYPRALMRLPAAVLAGRSRERVAGQIGATLAALGLSLDPPRRPREGGK
jgi:hypothetical protein